ncbi:hypothetical protein PR048_014044 [Dryococelus australis]|uniref:Uncharacterized protein n=1 Tax=Dryococelus australis TaxID=614101 RepID=A0ABQ9HUS7_9NEOP|nr:hypothetical protein PR048_014044 [Dryococelus australis]
MGPESCCPGSESQIDFSCSGKYGKFLGVLICKWECAVPTRYTDHCNMSCDSYIYAADRMNASSYCGSRRLSHNNGAAVAERLACSPPIMTNRAQSPAGSLPDYRMWESCRAMPMPFHSGAAPYSPQSPSPALKHSLPKSLHSLTPSYDRRMNKVTRHTTMLNSHRVEEYATCLQVDLKQGFQKGSLYREQPIVARDGTSCSKPQSESAVERAVLAALTAVPMSRLRLCRRGQGGRTVSLLASQQSTTGSPDFPKQESCRTMPLVGGSSRGPPVSPTPSFWRRSILTSITLIGCQDLAVKIYESNRNVLRSFGRELCQEVISPFNCYDLRKPRGHIIRISGPVMEKTASFRKVDKLVCVAVPLMCAYPFSDWLREDVETGIESDWLLRTALIGERHSDMMLASDAISVACAARVRGIRGCFASVSFTTLRFGCYPEIVICRTITRGAGPPLAAVRESNIHGGQRASEYLGPGHITRLSVSRRDWEGEGGV